MPQPRKLIYGVGINDNPIYTKKCQYYRIWFEMLRRCYSERFQQRNPCYVGCTVDKQWHLFSTFKQWAMQQGDIENKSLDKDLLKPGNKVYSPDTCIFVPTKVNVFLAFNKANTPNKYMLGVRKKSNSKNYTSYIKLNHQYVHIGVFPTEQEAHQAYVKKKKEIALMYKEETTDQRLKDALQNFHDHVEEYLK